MQMRDHEAVRGKRDSYPVDPRALKIDPAYNVRDMNDPETIAHIRMLADSIKENGVRVPLEVRLDGEDIYVVAGHCRLAGTMLAIKEGAEIETVPTIPEPKGTNEVERVLNLVISNSGKPLTPLAIAEVVRRLLQFGWDNAKIAQRLGWKSASNVEQYTALLGADADVQAMVRSGAVSASTAAKVIRKEGNKAGATLKAAAASAKTTGKKAGKVTSAAIKKSKGEFDAKPANVKLLIDALKVIAKGGEPKAAGKAARALDSVGIDYEA